MDILQNNNSETSKANGNKEGLGFNIEHLVNESRKALKNSYSPYSRFPVGAALLCQDGSIYRGKEGLLFKLSTILTKNVYD